MTELLQNRSDILVCSLVRALQETASREELHVLRTSIEQSSPLWVGLLRFADDLTRLAARLELPQSAEAAAKAHEPPQESPPDEGLLRTLGLDKNLQPVPQDFSLVRVRSSKLGGES
jgi:hypothetical protein